MLKYLGIPLTSIPIRVEVGDIVLFSSNLFLTHGVKLTTNSRVLFLFF